VPSVLKSGSLNLLEPSQPVQACTGTALPFLNVKLSLSTPGKHIWVAETQLHSLLTSAVRGGERSASRPDRVTLVEEPYYPINRGLGASHSRRGRSFADISRASARNRPTTVHLPSPQPGHYNMTEFLQFFFNLPSSKHTKRDKTAPTGDQDDPLILLNITSAGHTGTASHQYDVRHVTSTTKHLQIPNIVHVRSI
jgi:hypothetical protein